MMLPTISWIVEALIASALLMAGVLAVRGPVRRLFGPQIAYALWALPLLRLLLPPLPAGWREAATTPISRASETITVLVTAPEPATVTAAATASHPLLGATIALLWGAGAAAFLAWHLVRHAVFCRSVLARRVALDEIAGIRVIASAAAAGPLAFGVFRRYIAFPIDFTARYDSRERDLALAHELGHHLRGDLVANWAALGVLALHWYNPVAWIAFRAFRADQEMANDARVLAGRDPALRHAYACAIVKSAHGGAVSAACHLHTINDLKGRLKMIGTTHASRRRLFVGSIAVGSMTVLALGTTASGTQAAETVRAKVESATGVDLAALAPAAEAAPMAAMPETVVIPSEKRRHRIMIVKDGNTKTYEGADADAYIAANPQIAPPVPPAPSAPGIAPRPPVPPHAPNFPEITSRDCQRGEGGGEKQVVVHHDDGQRRIMIICSNRIAKIAADGARVAANSEDIERHAMEAAMSGMRSARASIETSPGMTAEERKEALAGIDEGIAEMRADMAKGD